MRFELEQAGIALTGPIEQPRTRPWSTHLVAPTSEGRHWFKENCPPLRFEAGLVSTLAQLVPGSFLEPIAVDVAQGWMLTPDGGAVLDGDVTLAAFGRTLAEFAVVQRKLVGHGADLMATGLPARPIDQTASQFADQLNDLAQLPNDHPLHIDPDLLARCTGHLVTIAEAVRRLTEVSVPDSLQHNDLHPQNTFAAATGGLRFFDFGDAVWSHPFCVLNIALHRVARAWDCPLSDERIERLINIYLDVWSDLAPYRTLRALVEPALTIAKFHRYNSWHQLIPYMPLHQLQRHVGHAESLATTKDAP